MCHSEVKAQVTNQSWHGKCLFNRVEFMKCNLCPDTGFSGQQEDSQDVEMTLWYSLVTRWRGGRQEASVAMVVWQEHRCILALEPNATLIFSLANLQLSLHSLFVSQSSLLLSVTLQLLPASHANLQSAAFCQQRGMCKKALLAEKDRPCDRSPCSQWPPLNSQAGKQGGTIGKLSMNTAVIPLMDL